MVLPTATNSRRLIRSVGFEMADDNTGGIQKNAAAPAHSATVRIEGLRPPHQALAITAG